MTQKLILIISPLIIASAHAKPQRIFILKDTSCYLLAVPSTGQQVIPKQSPLGEARCEQFKTEATCQFKDSSSVLTFGGYGKIKFKVETNKAATTALFSKKKDIKIIIDREGEVFRYAEIYAVENSPFLISKHCYGTYILEKNEKKAVIEISTI